MRKQELVATVGLPASGKTTWAEKFVEANGDYINVNRDDIRLMLCGRDRYKKFKKWREEIVTEIQTAAISESIRQGKSVIVSDTNLNPKVRESLKAIAAKHNVAYREDRSFLEVPYGECIERDKLREHPVGQSVIVGMYQKYRELWIDAGLIYQPNELAPNAFIFDIDGTLAEMDGRSPHDESKVSEDKPVWPVIHTLQMLRDSGDKIVILSGRSDSCREDTEEWLSQYVGEYDALHQRNSGDYRKDWIVKRQMFNKYVAPFYHVQGVFDDRDQVVHMWRGMGIPVFQVNYGNF